MKYKPPLKKECGVFIRGKLPENCKKEKRRDFVGNSTLLLINGS
jgi:hypothetical protein